MKSFKLFFEDFNNWRKPTGAIDSGKNCTWNGTAPAGFKGDGGLYSVGHMTQVQLKTPKEKRPIRPAELQSRKRHQKTLIALYKQLKQISALLRGKR